MRVLNEPTLKSDIDLMFDQTMVRDDKKVREWFKGAWLKQLVKSEWFTKNYLHKITVVGNAGMFEGFGKAAESLLLRVGGKKIQLRQYSEYDVKDAKSGLLYWYQPTTHSLNFYKNQEEIILVKDYFAALLDADSNTDLRRINAQDAIRAARNWHTEEALRREREKKEPALRVWRTLSEGRDWTPVCEIKDSAGNVYKMIRLISASALVAETELMDHCTYMYKGDRPGHSHIFDGETVVVSVRLKKNMAVPVVTAEFHVVTGKPVYIVQVQPYHNGWTHPTTGKKATIPAGLEASINSAAHSPDNQPRFQPMNRPGHAEFEVNKK